MLFSMDLVDVLIIMLLILAVIRGLQSGMLQLLLSSVGFIAGLFLGSWIAKHLAVHFSNPTSKLVIILVIEFGIAIALTTLGEVTGVKLSKHAIKLHLGKANEVLGAGLEIAFTLFAVWLIAAALVNIRSNGIGREIKHSAIIRGLNNILPTPPDLFAELEKIVSPNGFPNVFLGLEPQHTTISPSNSVNDQAVLRDEKSVVKIQGAGCGGIVSGSGFVVAKNIVVTNAHVVAGISHSEILDQYGPHPATAIWFDPNMDIAILRTSNLNEPALTLSNQTLPNNDAAAILGYPGGGPLVANNAAIIDHVPATGRNIYNQGITVRNIYEIQADVEPGDSGGPLLAPDGSVAGVVFSKSLSQNNVGYALLINQVKPLITKAEQQNAPVGTGSCAQD